MGCDTYIEQYLKETIQIASEIDKLQIKQVIEMLSNIKQSHGRLFILGVGGSAANASHAVNDFRKIAGIETYAPSDNVAELTARTNDEGWDTTFYKWLEVSHLNKNDALLVLSVGGGSDAASPNIKKAIDLAKATQAKVIAIVSREGGYARPRSDACILVPVVDPERITPHAEGWQSVICHIIVNALA